MWELTNFGDSSSKREFKIHSYRNAAKSRAVANFCYGIPSHNAAIKFHNLYTGLGASILFQASELKIKRARQHIRNLNSVFTRYLKQYSPVAEVIKNPETGRDDLYFKRHQKPFPKSTPLILGDAIHNIRSALDHMIYELVIEAGGNDSRYLQLPVLETRDQLENHLNGSVLKGFPTICDFIINGIRSYERGNPQVWGLHRLDITDKHKLLIPTLSFVGRRGIDATTASGGRIQNNSFLFGTGSKGAQIIKPISGFRELKITNHGSPMLDIRFAQGQPFAHQSVIPILNDLINTVLNILAKATKLSSN